MSSASATSSSEGEFLFPVERLTKLSKWSEICSKLKSKNLVARPLRLDDYENGYLDLLASLTKVGNIDQDQFHNRFHEMKRINETNEHYIIVIIQDASTKRVVGCSTLFLELKFIHECAVRGRLEDVAILESYRGHKIGLIIVQIICELAREAYNCYKLSLDCTEELKNFYAKNSFTYNSNMLSIRYYD